MDEWAADVCDTCDEESDEICAWCWQCTYCCDCDICAHCGRSIERDSGEWRHLDGWRMCGPSAKTLAEPHPAAF